MPLAQTSFAVTHYNLSMTLGSGQTFRWRKIGDAWEGVIGRRWVRLRQEADIIHAETVTTEDDTTWLGHYLQTDVDLETIVATFPKDAPMQTAVEACRGLRLLRQEPWECLASFICSSTKQIVQIEQIVDLMCRNFGEPVPIPPGANPLWSFPTAQRLAGCSETELRVCKLGFRAPYILDAASKVASGEIDLPGLGELPLDKARGALTSVHGVGEKIANCVLLFAYGFPGAFPVDVWIMKALSQLYFPKRRPKLPRLRKFSETHFAPQNGYAQQYLFHYMRTMRRPPSAG